MLACTPIDIAKKTDGKPNLLQHFVSKYFWLYAKKSTFAKQNNQHKNSHVCSGQNSRSTTSKKTQNTEMCNVLGGEKFVKSTSIAFCQSNADWLCQNT